MGRRSTGIGRLRGDRAGGGKTLTIATPDGYSVTLVHLGSYAVRRGDARRGGPVRRRGRPERPAGADGAVCHLGVRRTVDPQGYLDPLAFLPRAGPTALARARAQPAPQCAARSPSAAPAGRPPVQPPPPVPAPAPASRLAVGPPAGTTCEPDDLADSSRAGSRRPPAGRWCEAQRARTLRSAPPRPPRLAGRLTPAGRPGRSTVAEAVRRRRPAVSSAPGEPAQGAGDGLAERLRRAIGRRPSTRARFAVAAS